MQLDIFEHSRDVILRNGVVDALRARDIVASSRAIASLAAEYSNDSLLKAFNSLCQRLDLAVAPPLDHPLALEILRATEDIVSAAQLVFGSAAGGWLSPFWVELATAIAHLPFDPCNETLHAAPLLLRAGSWAEASVCIETIPAWRRQPAPLAWKLEAQCRISGLGAAWAFLAELSWMAPQRVAVLAVKLSNPELTEILRHFEAEFEAEGDPRDFAWFPAWALIVDSRWATGMRLAQLGANLPPERCARLLLNLLLLERQGRHLDVIECRRKRRDTHKQLFDLYMRSR